MFLAAHHQAAQLVGAWQRMRVGGVLIVDRPLRPARLRPARTPALLCLRQALLGSLARDIGKARPTHVTGPNWLLCLMHVCQI